MATEESKKLATGPIPSDFERYCHKTYPDRNPWTSWADFCQLHWNQSITMSMWKSFLHPVQSGPATQIEQDPASEIGTRAWWEQRGRDEGIGPWDQTIQFSEYVQRVASPYQFQLQPVKTCPMPESMRKPKIEIKPQEGDTDLQARPSNPVPGAGTSELPLGKNDGVREVPGTTYVARNEWTEWAYRLKERHDRGEALNPNQVRCFHNALKLWPGGAQR